jgi:hypothetical protein
MFLQFRNGLVHHGFYFISKSIVNAKAKRRRYGCTAREADKVRS